ncbi:ROK family transcriptional regulator [Auraticoccus monumenti]|uniref:ROK family transcriptional regulator n=1 Tax=Auraticoccus monumenti TaxID=675864 RepID=UPI001E2D0DC3|nr:ROK family transcriptional regulator [Auraticoccus monumenti]
MAGSRGRGVDDVLSLLRDRRPRTRAELVVETGLSRSTVGARLDVLQRVGLVVAAGEARSSGGRPPARVEFNPAAGLVLAIDLGATHGTVALTDLSAAVLASRTLDLDIADGPEPVLETVLGAGADLLASVGRGPSDVVGVGIGVPGPVEHATGRPITPPIMPGWDRFDIPAHVRRHLDAPVLVDNDVNLLALAEHAGPWSGVDDLLVVKVSTGIGAGIIAGGTLQRGGSGSAGDLGHLRVPWLPDSPRPSEDVRDLEEVASGPAIAAVLRASGLDVSTSSDVVALVRAGDVRARDAVRQAGREVGAVLAGVVNLLNPSVIVLGGSIARAGEHLVAGVREVVYGRSIPLATHELRVVPSSSGEVAGVLGATSMVTQQLFSADPAQLLARRLG